jgi:surface carbohydrate biosynthesis protein
MTSWIAECGEEEYMQALVKKYKWLILPIETKVRELDGKILLAAMAVERGWGVILGHKDTIVKDSAEIKGIVLEKDGHAGNYRIKQFYEAGKHVCALDEEGLVYHNGEDYFRRRLNPDNYQKMNTVFLWGAVQRRDVLEHIRIAESKLVLTGNPRFDLLRPEFRDYFAAEAARLKNKFGPFILVNTNFGESSHFMGTEWLLNSHRKSGFIANAKDDTDEMAFIGYQSQIADSFREMIPTVSARYPHYKIIIRPHPSEDHHKWIIWARNLKNVSVIHEGDVSPWLLAADMSIHNSCMTGIQGFLLEKPVITYMPIQSDQFDFYLPNALSIRTTTPDEVSSVVGRIANDPASPDLADRATQLQVAGQYMTAMSGAFASDRIIDVLETLDVEPELYHGKAPGSVSKSNTSKISGQSGFLISSANKLRKKIAEARLSDAQKVQLAYARQKFPGINIEDIQTRISKLQRVTKRFESIQIYQLGDYSFGILPE